MKFMSLEIHHKDTTTAFIAEVEFFILVAKVARLEAFWKEDTAKMFSLKIKAFNGRKRTIQHKELLGTEGHIHWIFPAEGRLSEKSKGKGFLGIVGIDKTFMEGIDPIKGLGKSTVGDQVGSLGKVALLDQLEGSIPLAEFVFLETEEMVFVAFPLRILDGKQRTGKEKQGKDKEA
jgi:hypothetical protein